MNYKFENQQEKDEAILEVQTLKEKLREKQKRVDDLAIKMAQTVYPNVDWLDLTSRERDYYWSEARDRIYWEERLSKYE